jgi:hypothetical protein
MYNYPPSKYNPYKEPLLVNLLNVTAASSALEPTQSVDVEPFSNFGCRTHNCAPTLVRSAITILVVSILNVNECRKKLL